ncbi:uncharacterized protein LOC129573690 [Sitodiplosis mosellana]|uniref:uncharacterized protein LOC129573690 n=1 Tax=Sitodiplosis mosellana TaxID=263140 RepID=UPI002444942D|nr:uncharacterized protein LOC129573690 [Sitodiplosis mosellana]
MDNRSDSEKSQPSSFWFRGFSNEWQSFAQNIVDTSRAAYRPHLDDKENIDPNEVPPAKRRRLSQVLLPVGNEDQGRPLAARKPENASVAVNDIESVAVANNTVTDDVIHEKQNDTASVSQADTEPLNELSEAEPKPNETTEKPKMFFDLLDEEVLVKIFDHLDLYDLLQMSDEDTRIEQIIAEKIMPSRVLNISKIRNHYSIRHAFKHFGEHVRELVVKQSDIQWKDDKLSEIEEIIRLIGKRCSDGKLKKLSISFDMNDIKSSEFRTQVPECFKAIESLTIIHASRRSANFDHCLETLLTSCTGLKSLTLNRIGSNGKFLTALNAIKLQQLTIDDCYLTESKFWLEFVQKGIPSLEFFGWDNLHVYGLQFREEAFVHISTAFPCLGDLSFDAASVSMEKFITFAQLPGNPLNVLQLKCSWHDYRVPTALPHLWYLQQLHIEFHDRSNPIDEEQNTAWKYAMKSLTTLKIIKMQSSQYRFGWDTFIDLVANLPNVQLVHFQGKGQFLHKHIENIVSCSPQILGLKLDVPIKAFTPKLYNTLVRDRTRWYRKSPKLYIFMDAQKVSSLKKSVGDYATKANCISLNSSL